MQSTTKFKTIPGTKNISSKTGSKNIATKTAAKKFASRTAAKNISSKPRVATQYPFGEILGHGVPFTGIAPYSTLGGHSNIATNPLLNGIEGGLGFGAPLAGLGLNYILQSGRGLLQTIFSETGLVLGPINGGMNSFIGNGFGAVSSLMTLTQGVASAQAVAHAGLNIGQPVLGNVATQGLGRTFLTSLIRVRYFDKNSTFLIAAEIAGGNSKNINVTVVGEEIRVWKLENGAASKTVVNASNFGIKNAYYALPLPFSVDARAITAVVKDGILTITLQKAKEISRNVHQVNVK